ncbi:MAG TPA: hypothetical protein VFI29_22825 [Hanamia sp.]|nr:hypothetical protein [Hanamia sp.]
MAANTKYTFRKILAISIWVLLGAGSIVLLVAAISKKYNEPINGLEIQIKGVQNNYFIDKKDVINILKKVDGNDLNKIKLGSINLTAIENELQKDKWIKNAEAFFDNNNVLQIKITEREPVARIFTSSGASFYIDSSLTRLPLSNKFSARLPVFTGFPSDAKVLKKSDSALLNGTKIVSEYINSHPFWMAQIDQVDITPAGGFELTPKLGNQLIRFGNADNCEEKFNKLLAFYEQVQTRIGWNKYSVIDIRFKNQVVGVNRNEAEIKSDSLRTIQIMKNNIEEALKKTNDSSQIQLPQPPDDNNDDKVSNSPVLKNVPNEATVESKILKKKSNETKVSTVAPIHDPEKPFIKKQISDDSKSVIRHPSSNEKPNPLPIKNPEVKKEELKKTELKKTEIKKDAKKPSAEIKKPPVKVKRVPKAVMPPQNDY